MNNSNTANNSTDKYLVDKVLSGDPVAFASIIKNTEGLVAQIVFKMIFDTAEECSKLKPYVVDKNEENFDRLEAELAKMV